MPKKTETAANASQREFITRNCETHDGHALAEATGLDVETCTTLRDAALADEGRKRSRSMGKVVDGVFAVNKAMSDRIDDAAKRSDLAFRPSYIVPAFPDA